MAVSRKKKKDYHVCEFCKMHPCAYTILGEVEYGTHCRSYVTDTKKIENDKRKGEPLSLELRQLLGR